MYVFLSVSQVPDRSDQIVNLYQLMTASYMGVCHLVALPILVVPVPVKQVLADTNKNLLLLSVYRNW